MNDSISKGIPEKYQDILLASQKIGFSMPSDLHTGALLKTLVASKPNGNFLELGTGTGLGTAWLLDGMQGESKLISVENEANFLAIAQTELGGNPALTLVCEDAEKWILASNEKFDLIFADTWAGKYLVLEKTLSMLNSGGIYMIDDMLRQPNWPDGHDKKVENLIEILENRADLVLTKMNWASGIIIAVKK